ncbi:hypothetical protein LXL04_009761 [Taraxacum kok-saghyz]
MDFSSNCIDGSNKPTTESESTSEAATTNKNVLFKSSETATANKNAKTLKQFITLEKTYACNCVPESADHLFLRCSTVKDLRARVSLWWPNFPDPDRYMDVCSFIEGASDARLSKMDRLKTEVITRAFFWSVWCNRNNIHFRGKITSIPNLEYEVKNTSFWWMKIRSKFGRNLALDDWLLLGSWYRLFRLSLAPMPSCVGRIQFAETNIQITNISELILTPESENSPCWDLLRTHIFPRTRELPQFPIFPKPLFLSKNRLRNPPKPVLKQNKKLCTYAHKKSLHICKVFGKKKSFFRNFFFATGLIFERFLAPEVGFSKKLTVWEFSGYTISSSSGVQRKRREKGKEESGEASIDRLDDFRFPLDNVRRYQTPCILTLPYLVYKVLNNFY